MNEQATELSEKLARLQWLMHKHHLRTHAENGPMADTTRGQGRILAILKMQDGISTKDLSYLLGIRVSSLNELLAKMEKSGYITREPSASDKRVMLIKLTEKGREERAQEKSPDAVFACLSEEEQVAFASYLDRMIAAMEAELAESDDEGQFDWWTHGARERMGDELFDRFASMRRGRPMPKGHPFDCAREFGGFPPRDGNLGRGPGRPPKPPKGPHEQEDE